jgi:type III secretion system FlhB-like substrate exporter
MSEQSTNKRVVGISYDSGDSAPVVMLKAAGAEATTVLDAAQQREDLHIVRDPALVDRLYRLPMDGPISRELFPVMALLLAHVLRVDKDRQEIVHE